MKKQVVASIAIPIASIIVALIGKFEKIKFPSIAGSPLLFIGAACIFIVGMIWVTTLILSKKKLSEWKEHPIFKSFHYWNNYIDNTFVLEDKARQAIFRDMLKNKCAILEKMIYKIIPDITSDMNEVELNNKALDIFYQFTNMFKQYYKNINYSEQDQKTLDRVMEKFMVWQSERNEMIVREIDSICGSDGYGTIRFKVMLVLQLFQIGLASTIIDAAKTLRYLNGELKKFEF